MTVHIVWHAKCLEHVGAAGHPETPERLRAIIDALEQPERTKGLEWHEAPAATREMLERVHPPEYVDRI